MKSFMCVIACLALLLVVCDTASAQQCGSSGSQQCGAPQVSRNNVRISQDLLVAAPQRQTTAVATVNRGVQTRVGLVPAPVGIATVPGAAMYAEVPMAPGYVPDAPGTVTTTQVFTTPTPQVVAVPVQTLGAPVYLASNRGREVAKSKTVTKDGPNVGERLAANRTNRVTQRAVKLSSKQSVSSAGHSSVSATASIY